MKFYRVSKYRKISGGCDCPSCVSLRGLDRLAGPWSTGVIVAIVIVAATLVISHYWTAADQLLTAAIKG